MLGPMLDVRQQVRCKWAGAPNASVSVARLGSQEITQNLATNPRCTSRSGFMAPTASVTADGLKVARVLNDWTSCRVMGVPASSVGERVRVLARVRASRDNLPGFNIRGRDTYHVTRRIDTDWSWVEASSTTVATEKNYNLGLFLSPVGSEAGDWFEVSHVLVTIGDYAGPYFDGSTTDPEVLMDLYATFTERERDL